MKNQLFHFSNYLRHPQATWLENPSHYFMSAFISRVMFQMKFHIR